MTFKFVKEKWISTSLEWNVWAHFSGSFVIASAFTIMLMMLGIPDAMTYGCIIAFVETLLYEIYQGFSSVGFNFKDCAVNIIGVGAWYNTGMYLVIRRMTTPELMSIVRRMNSSLQIMIIGIVILSIFISWTLFEISKIIAKALLVRDELRKMKGVEVDDRD